MHCWTDC